MAFDQVKATPWTNEAVMMAVRMDKEGKTGTEISEALWREHGVYKTKSAVHGKLNRLRGKSNRTGRVNIWTKEAEARFSDLWMDGLSAYEISRVLTSEFDGVFSVYAVNCRRAKIGLPKRSKDLRKKDMPTGYQWQNGRNRSGQKVRKPLRSDAHIGWHDVDTGGVSLIDLTSSQCRWPYADSTFCGAQKARGAYCAHHAERAFRPKERATEAAQKPQLTTEEVTL